MGNPEGNSEAQALEQYKILAAAREFLERLMSTIRYSELFDSTYAVSSRLKKQSRLQDKIRSRQSDGRAYNLADVTDIIGIRFISLYRRDITNLIRSVLQLVFNDSDVNPNALSGMKLVELKAYTSSPVPEQDPVNVELRSFYETDYFSRSGVKLEIIPRSRYSSVHMVLKIEFAYEDQEHVLPVELQFRSVFEDAWAEIDHKLLYEIGRFNEPIDERQREAMAQHMTVLKKMVDTAADYADVIRRTVIVSRQKPVTIERNLDAADYIRELGSKAGIPIDLVEKLGSVLSEKSSLDKQIEQGRPDVSAHEYVDVANKLATLIPLVVSVTSSSSGSVSRTDSGETIVYSIRMEEALCRLLSGEPQQVRSAVESYASITKNYPAYPGGWYRSAQAYQRLSEAGDPCGQEEAQAALIAFENFDVARVKLTECLKLKPAKRIFLVSPEQEKTIAANAERLRGFSKWRFSDRRRRALGTATDADLDDVLTAYKVTKVAFDRDGHSSVKLTNNLAFYAADAHAMAKELGVTDGLPSTSEISALIPPLVAGAGDDILRLDSVVRAYETVGNMHEAVATARRILDLNAEGERVAERAHASLYVQEMTKRATQHAWRVIRAETLENQSQKDSEITPL